MNSILGHLLVHLGLGAAGFGLVLGLIAGFRQSPRGLRWTEIAAYVFSAALILANLVMIWALLSHDFSVSYVAKVGSRSSPTWVTVVSLWSSLEGSLLFWAGVLGAFIALFTISSRGRFRDYMAFALAISLGVAAFFTLLLAGPADPFAPISPVPADGPGPNPLLQNHLLMVLHPPALYLGYVGLTIPYAIAMAAVLRGKLGEGWLVPLRTWTLGPWILLTVGIILGGWWAYEVLGWGGYWAWDPVENASLLPWLAATGYLHSAIVHERRRVLKVWTLSLVVVAFLLTLLGTFMTRSGIFNSVHAFAQSDIGPVFLAFIAVALLFSLGALAGRGHLLESEGRLGGVLSRETSFLLNNLVLLVFTFTVLLGTIYPLLTEALQGRKVSVGEPYFNQMAAPLGLMLVFLMGVGPALPWGRADLRRLAGGLGPPVAGALVTLIATLALGLREPLPLATFALSVFATVVALREIGATILAHCQTSAGAAAVLQRLAHTLVAGRRRIGGHVVHLGVVMIVVAIAASSSYKQVGESALGIGQSLTLGDFRLTYLRTEGREDPHRFSVAAHLALSRGETPLGELAPRLNFYATQREPVGAPAVRAVRGRDVYASLLSFENDGSQVVIKAFVNPLVSWLWWSLPLLCGGTLLAAWPRRRALPEVKR